MKIKKSGNALNLLPKLKRPEFFCAKCNGQSREFPLSFVIRMFFFDKHWNQLTTLSFCFFVFWKLLFFENGFCVNKLKKRKTRNPLTFWVNSPDDRYSWNSHLAENAENEKLLIQLQSPLQHPLLRLLHHPLSR